MKIVEQKSTKRQELKTVKKTPEHKNEFNVFLGDEVLDSRIEGPIKASDIPVKNLILNKDKSNQIRDILQIPEQVLDDIVVTD